MNTQSYFTAEQSLQNKSVVIVGGTSGIGLAAAIQAKTVGADVTIIGRDGTVAAKLTQEYQFAGWRVADVTQSDSLDAALKSIDKVDHLVLLAGSYVAGTVLDADPAYLRRAFDERIWAAVTALRAVAGRLSQNGSVTFISGVLADRPSAQGTAVLAAASAAMEAFGRGMALEMAPIRFNTLSPGPIDTPLLTKTLGEHRDAVVAAMSSNLPQKRLGTAEEAGAGVVFLMTNGWMNGATLHLDGAASLV